MLPRRTIITTDTSLKAIKTEVRNKTIDEFVTKAYRKLGCSEKELYCVDVIDEIAKQMRGNK